ncbi:RNA polymerase sigma factor [Methylomonas methanica]|uniref:RNA polymerase, sigma-24 subunit, ECF subfamily n=1 Tax=Methylomonas methanica (strain DSM 25384 / MC09) TaxID=857087 RepID=G0A2Z6_METMM|nr:sigma-70 family RNA polymerase sigma factor [Methylomonas methanica]AEG02655.1 RNA polymerase, sigma-24 subunit, ECF subfamily [Methylomonas methanica MC09]
MTSNGFLDKLFRRHNKELLFFATQRAGNAAEDLVQEAYIRLLQHPDPESIKNVRAFLFRTTSNLSIDLHRRQMLEARYQADSTADIDMEPAAIAVTSPAPETHISHQLELDLLRDMLQELPELTRYAFVLNRIEGLSHAEIAKRLGMSVRNSERHLAIALRHLLKHPGFGG